MGFLTIGRFDESDPRAGHLETLAMINLAETLGFDSVWLRDRHLQFGIASPVALMAAAAMRTERIELGTAVIRAGVGLVAGHFGLMKSTISPVSARHASPCSRGRPPMSMPPVTCTVAG